MEIHVNNKSHFIISGYVSGNRLKEYIGEQLGINSKEFYLLNNGKQIKDDCVDTTGPIHVVPRVCGGKGGFGSMLRAIGAQIEKTTNREACRDLSGRRLRDINEEQRLKNWINQQAEREKEAKERKKKKLERLCQKPKHEFHDAEYDKERSELPEIVEDAVLHGLQASCSTKRKLEEKKETAKKKKPKLWVDDELDEDLSCSEDDKESDLDDNPSDGSIKKLESESSVEITFSTNIAEDSIKCDSKKSPGSENGDKKFGQDASQSQETTEEVIEKRVENNIPRTINDEH